MSTEELMMLTPMRTDEDYHAAVDRLEELTQDITDDTDNSEESEDAEVHSEVEVLQTLIDEFENREEVAEPDDDFEQFHRLPELESLSLATFEISNGNEVRVIGFPEENEIAMVEIAEAGTEDILLDDRIRPVAVFQRFATAGQPVPRMIQQLDSAGLFEGRQIVDELPSPVPVSLDALQVPTVAARTGGGSCQPGAAGAAYFKSHHCGTLGGPGYGSSESYCYENAHQWVQKTSSSRRRTTYCRMAACGNGKSRVRHLYKKASGWHTQLNIEVEPNKVVSYWSAKSGIKRKRRVRFESIGNGGWVRSWVKFHSQIAGGWS